jgi:energy-coupling factor transporter ATP-binding protein EcfA2
VLVCREVWLAVLVRADLEAPMSDAALRTDALTKRYGCLTALDALTLDVPTGEVFGFLGPNGAGKSTTIRLLSGLAGPRPGGAWIFAVDVGDVARTHRRLAYVPGDVALWPQLTGRRRWSCWRAGIDRAYRDGLVQRFALDVDKQGGRLAAGGSGSTPPDNCLIASPGDRRARSAAAAGSSSWSAAGVGGRVCSGADVGRWRTATTPAIPGMAGCRRAGACRSSPARSAHPARRCPCQTARRRACAARRTWPPEGECGW